MVIYGGPAAPRVFRAEPDAVAVMAGDDTSGKIEALEALRQTMSDAPLPLKDSARHLVFGEGSLDPKAFFIGEAPGAAEDAQGRPFVGRAGRELDELLSGVGLARGEVYITSVLKYRPPGNRPPVLDEINAHVPFLVEQIRIIRPAVIVPMGNFAVRFVVSGMQAGKMAGVQGISIIHGRILTIHGHGMTFTVLPVYHPAAVLYKRPLKRVLEEDFKKIPLLFRSLPG